jgi:sulfate adenylyltransferase
MVVDHLVAPHGGRLVDLRADPRRAERLRQESIGWRSWDLTRRQLSALELLVTGGFSPLTGFLGQADYLSVCRSMRLADGTLWPVPVVLDLPEDLARSLSAGDPLALRDPEGVMLAVVHVAEVWQPDREAEAEAVYGTTDPDRPGAAELIHRTHPWYVGGAVESVQATSHHDFKALRFPPAALRAEFADLGWRRVMAVHPASVMHRADVAATLRAAEQADANLLIQPLVGVPDPADVDHYCRVRALAAVLPEYPAYRAMLSLLPMTSGPAGRRETLRRAIVARNHGCSHLLVGPEHAGRDAVHPGADPGVAVEDEVGVTVVAAPTMVYLPDADDFVPDDEVLPGARRLVVTEAEVRERLARGRDLPGWFSYPDVVAELRQRHPPRDRQGFTVFFTGLSGSGKSTVANVLVARFLELGGRPVTLLDGDLVRKHLSSELGFSREHRDINIRRIGFVASEITRNGGIAICAPIAPYDSVRQEVRRQVAAAGGFVLVYIDTPLEVCESRDRKGLYAKARAGLVKEFTGISDPYEAPADAEVVIDTAVLSSEEAAQEIVLHLEREGYIRRAVPHSGLL